MTELKSKPRVRAREPTEAEFKEISETIVSVLCGMDIFKDYDEILTGANKKVIARITATMQKLHADVCERYDSIEAKRVMQVNKETLKSLDASDVEAFIAWKEANTPKQE